MSDVFDDLAKAYSAGLRDGRSEAADEIERLRMALLQIAGKVSQSDKSFDGDMASDIARAALGEGK